MKRPEKLLSNFGQRLRFFRLKRGLTLTGLAEKSGISKSSLSVMEEGKGNPTISTIWRLANALEVPFGELIQVSVPSQLEEIKEKDVSVLLIERTSSPQQMETYLMKLKPYAVREAEPHIKGVKENILVLKGRMVVGDIGSPKILNSGEVYEFNGDTIHIYQALDKDVTAVVSIKYPMPKKNNELYTKYIYVNDINENREGTIDFIKRHIVEVINGIEHYKIVFKSDYNLTNFIKLIKKEIQNMRQKEFSFPIYIWWKELRGETELYLISRLNCIKCYDISFLYKWEKSSFYKEVIGKNTYNNIQEIDDNTLTLWLKSNFYTLSILSSEIFTIRGNPSVPLYMKNDKYQKTDLNKNITMEKQRNFEDRINVGAYNLCEVLHPGYARQGIEMARMIQKYKENPDFLLDVGTGPGHILLMLLEFFPELKTIAVDTSPHSCFYLKENVDANRVNIINQDFLEFSYKEDIEIICSAGSSHHLNTAFFFQKAYDLLSYNGILVVADEFLPVFTTEKHRNILLIKHHLMYIFDILNSLKGTKDIKISKEEQLLLNILEKETASIYFETTVEQLDVSIKNIRELIQKIEEILSIQDNNFYFYQFYVFIFLELQALAAGIDYEVEQKTHIENFLLLAEYAGFHMLDHKKVYPTVGMGKYGGGTHVFTFIKR